MVGYHKLIPTVGEGDRQKIGKNKKKTISTHCFYDTSIKPQLRTSFFVEKVLASF